MKRSPIASVDDSSDDQAPDALVARGRLTVRGRGVAALVAVPGALAVAAYLAIRADLLAGGIGFALVVVGATAATLVAVRIAFDAARQVDLCRRETISLMEDGEGRYIEALEREHQAVEHLRSVDQMKNTFLHAVSHELRTPLTVITGFSGMLADETRTVDPALTREFASRIAANAGRLQRLLGDLLDLDRFKRGVLQPRRHPTDVGELVRCVVAEVDAAGHEIVCEADVGTAIVDTAQLERIVENLVVNAVRHTPAGTPIWVRAARDDEGGLELRVDDAGPGVPDDLKATIFEEFAQGATEATGRGTGIGLSLVASFAALHGGRAWVEDRAGGGASFRVLLPSWMGHGKRILLVDWDGNCHLCEDAKPANVDIEQCAGPGHSPTLDHCPLIAEGMCHQARTADAIVMSVSPVPENETAQLDIANAYRVSYPDVPVILEVPGDSITRYEHAGDFTVMASPITEADVEDVLASKPADRSSSDSAN